MKPETLAIHSGRSPDLNAGAVAPPLVLSTTFERAGDGSYPHGHVYGRVSNPNREALERCLAALEGGSSAVTFGSGTAAIMAVMMGLNPGDHVIIPSDLYWGTAVTMREMMARWGLPHSMVDTTDLHAVQAAWRPNTKLLWLETPSNPLLKVTDIRQMAELTRARGALCAVDNTFATPILQSPLALGADLVMHSTTKYLGGHSDVLGGAIVGKTDTALMQRVRDFQTKGGAIPAPFDCWLLLRSIATLPLRVRAQSDNAAKLAQFLHKHPKVEAVHYPGLPSHPQHALAKSQMQGFGAMLSVQIRGGKEESLAVAAKTQLFIRATSLGGVESLIEHRASVEGPTTQTPQNLLRVSVGLEHIDDLIADFSQALGHNNA